MWCFASRPNQMLTLKFENFEDKDDQKCVYYYAKNKIKERDLQYQMIFMNKLWI